MSSPSSARTRSTIRSSEPSAWYSGEDAAHALFLHSTRSKSGTGGETAALVEPRRLIACLQARVLHRRHREVLHHREAEVSVGFGA
jgi:hypothetical protein